MTLISIIIPTYNREAILQKTLQAANLAIEGLDAEIIVVNDSKTSTPHIPAEFYKSTLINNLLQGPASARNLGARLAKSGNILFMDDDFIIDTAAIYEILTLLDQYPNDCFNFPFKYPADLIEKIEKTQFGRYLIYRGASEGFFHKNIPADAYLPNGLYETPECLGSGFLAIKKQLFENAGGYDENCKFAGEDAALMNNLKANGAKVYINSKKFVYHNEEDKTNLIKWLHRQYFGIKSTLESQKLKPGNLFVWPYSKAKEIILQFVSLTYQFWIFILRIIPNKKVFDFIYFKTVNLLYVVNLYRGYRDGIGKTLLSSKSGRQ